MEGENNGEERSRNSHEELSVTMVDVLEEEEMLGVECAAVLGASDEESCTYMDGAVKRQALYSCLTCCPEGRNDLEKCAGICLACSYQCHEDHELVELYTKRNFRCDCPTDRTGSNRCTLNGRLKQPEQLNFDNMYNQNFQGLYCSCHRPYPDPERTTEEEMLQCVICEDWFHLQHLNASGNAAKLAESCSEMVCDSCMEQHPILQSYTALALNATDNVNNESVDESVSDAENAANACEDNDDNKLKSDLDKSISEIMNMSDDAEEPPPKRQKLEIAGSEDGACIRPTLNNDYIKGPTFWGPDWRAELCRCSSCIDAYKSEKIVYLLDPDDPANSYEERGLRNHQTQSNYEQGMRALASMSQLAQIDVITEYNRMKDKLKEYLQTFAANNTIVTEEDINRFFVEIRNENNEDIGVPYTCR